MLKVGNLVVYDLWFGEIFDVIYRVIFMSDDGSIFAIEDPFQDDFININENTVSECVLRGELFADIYFNYLTFIT